MTERSMFWADGIGDGGPYSEDELRLLYDALAGSEDANRGVLVRQGSQLAPSSTGNNNIRMAIGRAVVDGTLYENDAILDIVTGSPVIGTTGRRLVIAKSWPSRQVRAVIITSADGVGAIPALTQNDGVVWMIPIASFTITTGGVIGALTDERELSGVSQPTQAVIKTADTAIDTDATLNDDPHLALHMAANEIWLFEAFIVCDGPPGGNIKVGFTIPSGTLLWGAAGPKLAAGSTHVELGVETVGGGSINYDTNTGILLSIHIRGTVVVGATPGDLQMQWAQAASDGGTTTVYENSWLRMTRVE